VAASSPRPWLALYPAGVPADLPSDLKSVPEMFRQAVERWPARDALVFSLRPGVERRWTYQELWDDVAHVAAGLDAQGFRKGDRLALYLPNCPEYVLSYYAALRLGLVVVQIAPLYIHQDLSTPLEDSRPRGIVTLDFLSHNLKEVLDPGDPPTVFLARLKEDAPWWARPFVDRELRRQGRDPSPARGIPHIPFARLRRTEGRVPEVPLDPTEDVAVLQYTGGTTGTPKGAMLTHANLSANARQIRYWLTSYRDGQEVLLCMIPFFHVYGMTAALNAALLFGATLVTQPSPPTADLIFQYVSRYRPTIFPGVPTFYSDLIHHPRAREADLRGIRLCVSGSAPLPVEVARRFHELTGGIVVEGYGLSETSPVTHVNLLGEGARAGSVGLPVTSTWVKVVDPADPSKELPLGTDGEIAVKGPQVMKGYYGRPEETRHSLIDGWFLTGDIGHVDEQGFTYIVDRKKDLVLVGGFNVYPREVEEVLYTHPAVAEAAVIGVPDPRLGEVVKAFVVRRPGVPVSSEELIEWVRGRLAHFKAPREVAFVPSLPRTLVGKVLKRSLRESPSSAASPEVS
jgi:long-chain acyl-CoA synthetase